MIVEAFTKLGRGDKLTKYASDMLQKWQNATNHHNIITANSASGLFEMQSKS